MELIGKGRYSSVFRGNDGVCVKQVHVNKMSIKAVARELLALRALTEAKAVNVVKFLGGESVGHDSVNIRLELMEMSLDDYIQNADMAFSGTLIKELTCQIVKGLLECHSLGIIHRDIKPGNILISKTRGTVKLADFGIARRLINKQATNAFLEFTNEICTRWYKPIEILFGDPNHSLKIDIWSLGCVVSELFLLNPIFPGWSDIEQLCLIQSLLGQATESEWPSLPTLPDYEKIVFGSRTNVDRRSELKKLMPHASEDSITFILGCLNYDPLARWSSNDCLQNQWLSEVRANPTVEFPQ